MPEAETSEVAPVSSESSGSDSAPAVQPASPIAATTVPTTRARRTVITCER
ncbi:hypothetical protein P9139_12940 [Curtobacterium flaccumfaciens]|nr:hypothetical protein P9139_12940 [Curtobacterium flaccumfaciens]